MAGKTTGKNTTTQKKVETPKIQNTLNEKTDVKEVEVVKVDEAVKKEDIKEEKKVAVSEAAPQKRGRKVVAKKTTEKKEVVKTEEKTVNKENDETQKKGRKTVSKNTKTEPLVPEVYLQYCGQESDQNAVIEKIKEQYVAEGHRLGNIKSLKVYLKPEDRAAYYVINDRFAGKVDLF